MCGQRGRQRGILREGVYAINLAAFVVITESKVHALPGLQDRQEAEIVAQWREELLECDGFDPIVVGGPLQIDDPLEPGSLMQVDGIGIVTVHDGPSLGRAKLLRRLWGMILTSRIITTTIRIRRISCGPADGVGGNT